MSSTDRDKSAQTANSPGWKVVNSRWLWWDGERYSAEWDGTQTIAIGEVEADSKPPTKPGWAKDPNDPTLMRYWDGTTWSDDTVPRPFKSGRRRSRQEMQTSLFITCVVVGISLTALALAIGPTREGPRSERCAYPPPPVDVSGWSWLVWLGVLAAAAVVIRGGWRSVHPWYQVLAVCGALAVMLTCPITLVFFEDADLVNC